DQELEHYFIHWCLSDLQQMRGRQIHDAAYERLFRQLEALFQLKFRFDLYFRKSRKEWTKAQEALMGDSIDRKVWSIFGSRVDYLFSGSQLTQILRKLSKVLPLEVHGGREWSELIPNLPIPSRRLTQQEVYESFAKHFAT